MRGATIYQVIYSGAKKISIHAPHAGRDLSRMLLLSIPINFNPRAPCGARPLDLVTIGADDDISIHAPHAGRDRMPVHGGHQ